MDIYREEILDHYKHPRNFGHLSKPDYVGLEYNRSCGDKIIIEMTVSKGKNTKKIRDIRFSGEGCTISLASTSMLTERALGMTFDRIMKISLLDIQSWLGTVLVPARVKCAVLGLEVLQKAITQK